MAEGKGSRPSPTTDLDFQEERLFRALGRSETGLRLAKAYIKCKNDESLAIGSKFDADDYLKLYDHWQSPYLLFALKLKELAIISAVCKLTMDELMKKDVDFGCDITTFLFTMSYFAPGDIPLPMISKLAGSRQELERIIQTLDEYSFLKWNRDTGVLHVDDLIRQANNRELDHEDCTLGYALKAVSDTDSTTIHHALGVWNRAAKCERWPKELHGLSCHIIRLYMDLGDYGAALRFGLRALEVVKRALAPNHFGLLKLKEIARSVALVKKTVEEKLRLIRESRLSALHQPERAVEFLARQHRLAVEMASNAKEASKVLQEVYEKRLVNLGTRHRDTLLTRGHIARLDYRLDRNKCDECYEILADVVEVLGDGTEAECEEIADIRRCFVQMLVQRGELDEALARARAYHEVYKRLLKPGHGITVELLKDIGGILLKRNDHIEALAIFTEVHKLQAEALGPSHFQVRETLNHMRNIKSTLDNSNGCQLMRELFLLGTLRESTKLFAQGKYHEAESLLETIEHGELPASSSIHLMAHALRAKMHARAYMVGNTVTGDAKKTELVVNKEWMKTVKHYDRGQVREFQEHYATALKLLEKDEYEVSCQAFVSSLMEERRSSTNEDVPQLKAQFDLAQNLRALKEFNESLRLFEEVFEKQKELLGPDDLVTLYTQHEIAIVLHRLNRHKDATEHFRQVYKKRMQLLGSGHFETFNANYNVARSLFAQEDYKGAIDTFRSVFDESAYKFDPNHPDMLKTQYYIAYCLSRQGNHLGSYPLFKEAYLAQERVLGAGHPDTLETKKRLSMCESQLKQDPRCPAGIDQALDDHTAAKTRDLYRNINEGNVEAVKNLLREPVDIAQVVTDQGLTPLHTATLTWNVPMVAAIVVHAERRLNGKEFHDFVDARTTSGKITALHLAAEGGHLEIVRFLLQHEAIYDLKNKRGKKPVDLAATPNVSKLLRLIDELFERTKRGETGVLDDVDGLSVDKIRAVFKTRNVRNQALTNVAACNGHRILAGYLKERYEERVTE